MKRYSVILQDKAEIEDDTVYIKRVIANSIIH
jgi:hypothetical protein